jgi:nucleotide-binding universal stress UspA family protein
MTTLHLATPPPLSPARANPIATANAMFSRILLAIDFGPASLGAARWGTSHVAPEADAVLMHVMPDVDEASIAESPDEAHDESHRPSPQQMAPAVIGGLGGFAATLEVASARNLVRAGRPSACLSAVANDVEASLLVFGRRNDANRRRVGEPNVIERAARRTSASVLVVPEGRREGPGHVIAAVDESRFAPHVLRVAGRLARMHEVPLTILHVRAPVAGAYERVIRSATRLVDGVRGRKHAAPRDAGDGTAIAVGDPAREIVRTAMEHEAPLVVVGVRGADEAPPGSIGSVTRELLTRAALPVLAVNAI